MAARSILCFVLLSHFIHAQVTITRDILDTRPKVLWVCGDSHSTKDWSKCTCKDSYNTLMSKENSTYYCHSPIEMGCYHSLLDSKKTYLVTKRNEIRKIIPSIHLKAKTVLIRVFVWNIRHGNIGDWYDITNDASNIFRITTTDANNNEAVLSISNLDLDVWSGKVVKIMFGNGEKLHHNCLTVKVKGGLMHPFNIAEFKKKVSESSVADQHFIGINIISMSKVKSTTESPATKPQQRSSASMGYIAIPFLGALFVLVVTIVKTTRKNVGFKRAVLYDINKDKRRDSLFDNPNYEEDNNEVEHQEHIEIEEGVITIGPKQ